MTVGAESRLTAPDHGRAGAGRKGMLIEAQS